MERPSTMVIRLLLAALLLPACQSGTEPPPTSGRGTASPATSPAPSESRAAAHRRVAPGAFDGLTITLDLNALSVRSGGHIASRLTISNDSGSTIVDPACVIGSGRYALVPVDDPDAELWLQPVVDCSGRFKMRDGFRETSDGPTFPATTRNGEPLPPGDYIAALEIEGRSERIEVPVKVE